MHQLNLRYAKLRRRNASKERQLVASLAEQGQQLPVIVVGDTSQPGSYVLVDGYKRMRALIKLRQDTVRATVWELVEVDAVLLERLMRTSESDNALEQGWLLEELTVRFGLSGDELARRFDKSQSWVSRRLALVRAVPPEVHEHVQSGALSAHATMKFLVPMARAKRADCIRLAAKLAPLRPSTRDVAALYAAWASGNEATREFVVTKPALALKAREQASTNNKTPEQTPGALLIKDFGVLVGVSRRVCTKLLQGAFSELLPTEIGQARRVAQQVVRECKILFEFLESSAELHNEANEANEQTKIKRHSSNPIESKPMPKETSCDR